MGYHDQYHGERDMTLEAIKIALAVWFIVTLIYLIAAANRERRRKQK